MSGALNELIAAEVRQARRHVAQAEAMSSGGPAADLHRAVVHLDLFIGGGPGHHLSGAENEVVSVVVGRTEDEGGTFHLAEALIRLGRAAAFRQQAFASI
jgi:hypothetical protein